VLSLPISMKPEKYRIQGSPELAEGCVMNCYFEMYERWRTN
jgi:hypothetical protein